MATRSQIILKNNKHVIDATGHRDVKSQRPWSRWPLATSQAPPSHSPPLPFHTSAYKSCRRVNGTPNGSNGRAYTNAVLSNIYLSAGPASHAHPVASKRPPAPTPGHYVDAHPDLLERSLPVLVRWVGSLHVTEHPVNHEARRGSLPPLALRALMYMHVSRPTVLPSALACGACIHRMRVAGNTLEESCCRRCRCRCVDALSGRLRRGASTPAEPASNLTRISHDLGARLEAVAVRAAAQEDSDEKMDFKNVMDFTPKKTFKINVSGEPWRF